MNRTLFFNATLLDKETLSPGAVLVNKDTIEKVFHSPIKSLGEAKNALYSYNPNIDTTDKDFNFFDTKTLTITPSFIDLHSHLREPGYADKETIKTGLEAALHGGYCAVVAMPNTAPIISSMEEARKNIEIAKECSPITLFQAVSITQNFDNATTSHIDTLDNAVVPIISEDGKDVENSCVLLEAMNKANKKNLIVSCHCEEQSLSKMALTYRKSAFNALKKGDKDAALSYLTLATSFLHTAENINTMRNIELARLANCHIHICHVSTKTAIDYIRYIKDTYIDKKNTPLNANNKFNLTCEVTPHHLSLSSDNKENLLHIVNPPLQKKEDIEALITAIKSGVIDVIATDHAPHTIKDKEAGAAGFSGFETSFSVCATLFKRLGIELTKLSALLSYNPASILGLKHGLLKEGFSAKVNIIDMNEEWIVDSNKFFSKGHYTPYDKTHLLGRVKSVYIKKLYPLL